MAPSATLILMDSFELLSLNSKDIVITSHSSAALEAISLGIPIVILYDRNSLYFEYLPEGADDNDKTQLKITFEVNEMLMNPQGSLHGGVMAAVMDISMGHLLYKTAGMGATIEMKIQYLRPLGQGVVTCEGCFIKKGRSLSFMESRLSGSDGKLAAIATATWKMPDA